MLKKLIAYVLVICLGWAGFFPAPGGSLEDCAPPPTSVCGG
jgi:hypothetical protein